MDTMMIVWLVLLILAILAELVTMGLTTIWFAGGALVAIFVTLLNGPIPLQIILFLLVSIVLLFFTRPIAVKYFNRNRLKTNVESMVGAQGIVTEEIDNLLGTGRVTVKNQEWTARTEDINVKIPVGTVITVLSVTGVKLIVRPDAKA